MKALNNVAGSLALAVFILVAPQPSPAQDLRGEIDGIIKDYLVTHPDEVGEIVKDYMIKHPEAVGQIIAELLKHRPAASTSAGATGAASAKTPPEASAAIVNNESELFSSPHQVTLGNPNGDVTLVEFFDYNCGFCKRALPDMLTLLKDDPKLKIVLKEFPSSDRARRMPRASPSRCACKIRTVQNILPSTGSSSAVRGLPAKKRRWRPRKIKASTWRAWSKIWQATRSKRRSARI